MSLRKRFMVVWGASVLLGAIPSARGAEDSSFVSLGGELSDASFSQDLADRKPSWYKEQFARAVQGEPSNRRASACAEFLFSHPKALDVLVSEDLFSGVNSLELWREYQALQERNSVIATFKESVTVRIGNISKRVQKQTQEISEMSSELDNLMESSGDGWLQTKIRSLDAEADQRIETLEKDRNDLLQMRDVLEQDKERLEQENSELQGALVRSEKEKEQLLEQNSSLSMVNKKVRNENASLKVMVQKCRDSMSAMEDSLSEQNQQHQKELQEVVMKSIQGQSRLQEVLSDASQSVSVLDKRVGANEEALSELKNEISVLKQSQTGVQENQGEGAFSKPENGANEEEEVISLNGFEDVPMDEKDADNDDFKAVNLKYKNEEEESLLDDQGTEQKSQSGSLSDFERSDGDIKVVDNEKNEPEEEIENKDKRVNFDDLNEEENNNEELKDKPNGDEIVSPADAEEEESVEKIENDEKVEKIENEPEDDENEKEIKLENETTPEGTEQKVEEEEKNEATERKTNEEEEHNDKDNETINDQEKVEIKDETKNERDVNDQDKLEKSGHDETESHDESKKDNIAGDEESKEESRTEETVTNEEESKKEDDLLTGGDVTSVETSTRGNPELVLQPQEPTELGENMESEGEKSHQKVEPVAPQKVFNAEATLAEWRGLSTQDEGQAAENVGISQWNETVNNVFSQENFGTVEQFQSAAMDALVHSENRTGLVVAMALALSGGLSGENVEKLAENVKGKESDFATLARKLISVRSDIFSAEA